MKKLITITALTALVTSVSFAQEQSIYDRVQGDLTNYNYRAYMTPALWNQYIDEICFMKTATVTRVNFYQPNVFWECTRVSNNMTTNDAAAFLSSIDAKLAGAGFFNLENPKNFPQITLASIASAGFAEKRPVSYAVLTAAATDTPTRALTNEEKLNRLVELMVLGELTQSDAANRISTYTKELTRPIKRYLREHGKTFIVGEDGKNPVQEIIDELLVVLQAPNCAGVKEWFATYIPSYTWVDPIYMTAEEVTELRDAVYYGEKDLTAGRAMMLQTALGITAYNAFIEQYNSDAAAAAAKK